MGKTWKQKAQDKEIAKSVIVSKSTEELENSYTFLDELLSLRKTKKLETTYVTGINKALNYNDNGKVYYDLRMNGTVTGRLSCAGYSAGKDKSKGVSFHTLPREDTHNIRKLFVAPKGYAFLTFDYSAMELRVLSHIAKELTMQKAFIEGLDLHSYSAGLTFNKSMSNVSKAERQIAKAVSFLIVYGGSEFTLARNNGITQKRAQHIMGKWYAAYPGVEEYISFIYDSIRQNEYAYSLFGRRRHLLNVRSQDPKVVDRALRQGLNFTIQSPSSDIMLCAILAVNLEFKRRKLKARIVATVHDSIEIICPFEEIWEVEDLVLYNMIENPIMTERFGLKLDVPLGVEGLIGHSFGEHIERSKNGEFTASKEEVCEFLGITL